MFYRHARNVAGEKKRSTTKALGGRVNVLVYFMRKPLGTDHPVEEWYLNWAV